jgi:hypothetical protein
MGHHRSHLKIECGDDSIFVSQKVVESRGQATCKLLPCKDLASGPKIGELHAPHNSVPLFEQI